MPQTPQRKAKLSEPISVVAHQLKSPISVIKIYLEVLLSESFGAINEKQREYLEDALDNVYRAVRTVTDLLDVSKIEENRYELKPKVIDLVEISKEVVGDLSPLTQASNCEIIFHEPEAPFFVNGDPMKIRQVIENLVTNALKYKFPGRGTIEIEFHKREDEVLFFCRDNGVGIPEEDFGRVFTKFYRSEDSVDMDPSGTGLGLYINKAIIELSGGKIWFEKNTGRGMTFYFTLPLWKHGEHEQKK